jgi:hypothetical protein
MKKTLYISLLAITALAVTGITLNAQSGHPQTVRLEQIPGEFAKKELNLTPGKYVFEVSNNGVDHEVGFVVARVNSDGTTGEHVAESYLSNVITDGQQASNSVVRLEKGTYRYFCPMNPTPEYTIHVK